MHLPGNQLIAVLAMTTEAAANGFQSSATMASENTDGRQEI